MTNMLSSHKITVSRLRNVDYTGIDKIKIWVIIWRLRLIVIDKCHYVSVVLIRNSEVTGKIIGILLSTWDMGYLHNADYTKR